MSTVSFIRTEGEKLNFALERELYLNSAGLKNQTNLTGILNSNRDLWEKELFFTVLESTPAEQDERSSKKLLAVFLANIIYYGATSQTLDHILSEEARSVISTGTGKVPFRATNERISNERKRQKRHEIMWGVENIQTTLNQHFLKKLDLATGVGEILNYRHYTDLVDDLEDLGLKELNGQAEQFLKDTRYISRELLKWFFTKKMDVNLDQACVADLRFLLNAYELRAYFKKINLLGVSGKFLTEMDLNPESAFTLDSDKRAGKSLKSSCFVQSPAQGISISIYPEGGVNQYISFLHSLGYALCYGFTDRDDTFEFRSLRDRTYTSIFSILFQNLIYEPKWLKKYLKVDTDSDFMKFMDLKRLLDIRGDAALLIYETNLHSSPKRVGLQEFYKDTLQDALHCEVNESSYLIDIEPPFRTAHLFKAWIIESRTRTYLRDSFDEQWWRVPKAGEFLKSNWCKGGRVNTKGILDKIGAKEPNINNLHKYFEDSLG